MKRVMYPGSFDPATNGHLDVIRRASRIVDELVVAVARNNDKCPLFSVNERVALLNQICAQLPNVKVITFEGLLVDAVRELGITAIIRGLRAVSDFEYEFQMALMNRELNAACETLFLMPSPEYSFISSHLIREIASWRGDISAFVPPVIADAIYQKYEEKQK